MAFRITGSGSAPSTATIGIVKRSNTQCAPEAIMFDVTNLGSLTASTAPSGSLYDHEIHDFRYIWNFGDAATVYTAPVNVLSEWSTRNAAYTKKASHVYRSPGTYSVSVTIIELSTGNTETASTEVTVGDFTALSGYREIQIGSDGADDYTTLAAALNAETSETAPTKYRVRKGHTETGTTLTAGTNTLTSRGHVFIVGDLGSGATPIVEFNDTLFLRSLETTPVNDLIFQDMTFSGGYDCTDNSYSYSGSPHELFKIWNAGFGTCLFDNCLLTDCGDGFTSSTLGNGPHDSKMITFHDTVITNWFNYGLYLEDFKTAILGCRIAQSSDVTSAWGTDTGVDRQHGPIRFSASTADTVIDGVDMCSQTGWFVNITSPNRYATQQPCLRWNMNSYEGAELHMARCAFEGGLQTIAATATNTSRTVYQQNLFITSCYALGSWMNKEFMTTAYGGITLENVIWVPTTATRGGAIQNATSLVSLSDEYPIADAFVRSNPIIIRNCDIIDELSTVSGVTVTDSGWTTADITVEDCQTFTSPSGSTHDVTELWSPRYTGYHSPNGDPTDNIDVITPRDTSKATPAEALKYELLTKVASTSSSPPYWGINMETRELEYKGAWGGNVTPTFSSATTNTAGTQVLVTISGGPITGTNAITGFTVKANGQPITLASASESSDVITLVIGSAGPLIDSETITVSYDGTGDWNNGGVPLTSFTGSAVTNASTVTADTTITGNFTADLDYSYTSGVDEIVDAYGATWNSGNPAASGPEYPVTFRDRGGATTTVIGGTSVGHHDLTTDWNTTYNVQSPRDNTANVMAKDTGGLTIFRNWHIQQVGWDCFRISSQSTGGVDTAIIESAYINASRDDFIENDDNCAITVRDCLFDAGFAGISFTNDRNSPGSKNVTMIGVLSRVTPYLYNGVSTHFGPCVKLSSGSMTWSATNCIFAFEKHDHRTDYVSLGWSKLSSSSNNYLLNLSDTNVSGSYPTPPSGWTFLQGSAARAKWNTEKAAWLARHGYS